MARQVTLPFEKRVFQGNRIAKALEELGIEQDKFLASYNSVTVERKNSAQELRAKQAELDAALAEIEALKASQES